MTTITTYVNQFVAWLGITGSAIPYVRRALLVAVVVVLAVLAELLCRRLLVPLVGRLTRHTEAQWDDVLFSERVLRSFSQIVPAVVVWLLLPLAFFEFPTLREALARLTAIYITVMATRTVTVFIDSFRLLEGNVRTARQQYMYTVCSVLKLVMCFIAAIVVVSIAIDKSPGALLTGLGAASAVMMLVFQDTIKGLVAGIRLTSNDMLHKGDWITVASAGANGTVEDITLTTVKVRNFDNTITTVTPQALVDGSFQNWQGMREGPARKQTRRVYLDFGGIRLIDDALRRQLLDRQLATEGDMQGQVVNLTLLRRHLERWLADCPYVSPEQGILVKQAEATQAGLPLDLVFWLKEKAAAPYERQTAEIMEYVFAIVGLFGLSVYQQFPDQQRSAHDETSQT